MPTTNKKHIVAFVILAFFFLIGVIKLFHLRFKAGDIYPEYSSLRSDPIGTKAFYASLENIMPDRVHRNYLSFSNITFKQNITFFYLGVSEDRVRFLSSFDYNYLNEVLSQGGRIIISFFPSTRTTKINKKKTYAKSKPDTNRSASNDLYTSLTTQWGFDFNYQSSHTFSQKAVSDFLTSSQRRFPDIPWHSTLYFNNLDKSWKVVYTYKGRPVAIEKEIKNGSIVLFSDSYIFSNEALQKERKPDLLAWCIGTSSHIIFDESHFGIKKQIGIIDLMLKYRLYWLIISILIFSALFVWKNASYFVPPFSTRQQTDINGFAVTRDHTQGLITLLRRNIHPDNILQESVSQWEKSFVLNKKIPNNLKEKLNKIKILMLNEQNKPKKQLNPIQIYRTIYEILSKRKPL